MSDTFSISVITLDGSALIAQATSANQIVMVDALSGTRAASDASDLATKDASWYNGISGSIEACSATDNIAKVVTRFGNAGANAQIVRSIAIRAKLASQSDFESVIIAAMSDANSEIYFPSSASPNQIVRFLFNIAVNAGDTVETVYADGATIADLERFVSMWKAGDPTQGEYQRILGDKRFNDYIYFHSGLGIEQYLNVYNQRTNQMVDVIVSNSDIGVSNDMIVDLKNINDCYINGTLYANGEAHFNSDVSFTDVSVSGKIDGILTTSSTVGELSTEYGMLGIKYANVLRSNLSFAGLYLYDSTGVLKLKLDSTNGSAEIGDLTISGETTAHSVFVTGLRGTAPYLSSGTLIIPVGGIVCAVADVFVSSYSAGDSISIAASSFKACDLSGNGSRYITAGTYNALSDTDSNGVTLLQRIS